MTYMMQSAIALEAINIVCLECNLANEVVIFLI